MQKPALQRLTWYVTTAFRLGSLNVARVGGYKALKRVGVYRWLLPSCAPIALDDIDWRGVGHRPTVVKADSSVVAEADGLLSGKARFFDAHEHDVGNPPEWLRNPFSGRSVAQPLAHWSDIADFDPAIGDIKCVWEMSRFGWALSFARAWRITGNRVYADTLWLWLKDWWRVNPAYAGPNWKCGQEASIRMVNVLLALHVAGQPAEAGGISRFVEVHCRRIAATLSYAIGQDNNHGLSEAAALFIGGTWLNHYATGHGHLRGQRWARQGRTLLERLVQRLVLPDGSFSQHSLTYHRVLLDTMSVAEALRRSWSQKPFSLALQERMGAACRWLGTILDMSTGDGPNLGANDGALPYRLTSAPYRDFRSTLQLASCLFVNEPAMRPGAWDESLLWLGVDKPQCGRLWAEALGSVVLKDGGYAVLRDGGEGGLHVVVRAPTAQFRPSQADGLHLDLWYAGRNILRDGGTYTYAGGDIAQMLASVGGHNTVQFDGRDQMPRIGRFLYAAWLHVESAPLVRRVGSRQVWSGEYIDAWGARHRRRVMIGIGRVTVADRIEGFSRDAVLRWRLAPGQWRLENGCCESQLMRLKVRANVPIRRLNLVDGWESRHYLEKTSVPVLEVEVHEAPAKVVTTLLLR